MAGPVYHSSRRRAAYSSSSSSFVSRVVHVPSSDSTSSSSSLFPVAEVYPPWRDRDPPETCPPSWRDAVPGVRVLVLLLVLEKPKELDDEDDNKDEIRASWYDTQENIILIHQNPRCRVSPLFLEQRRWPTTMNMETRGTV